MAERRIAKKASRQRKGRFLEQPEQLTAMVCPRRFQARVQEGAGSWLQKADDNSSGPEVAALAEPSRRRWLVGGPHARAPLRVSHTAVRGKQTVTVISAFIQTWTNLNA